MNLIGKNPWDSIPKTVKVDQRHAQKIWDIYITELYDRPNLQEHLEVEPEGEVDADEIGSYIFQSEVKKYVKELRDKKATGSDDVPGDVRKVLGEDGLRLVSQLTDNMYETRE